MMSKGYQEQKKLEHQELPPPSCQLATIAAVYSDGVTLQFDGEASPREKHYPCNAAVLFEAGQRVRIEKIAGEYVAAYPIRGRTA